MLLIYLISLTSLCLIGYKSYQTEKKRRQLKCFVKFCVLCSALYTSDKKRCPLCQNGKETKGLIEHIKRLGR